MILSIHLLKCYPTSPMKPTAGKIFLDKSFLLEVYGTKVPGANICFPNSTVLKKFVFYSQYFLLLYIL